MERVALAIVPDLLRLVTALEVHRPRVPVGLLATDVVAALEEEDALTAGCQGVGQGAAAGAGADDDDVEAIHGPWTSTELHKEGSPKPVCPAPGPLRALRSSCARVPRLACGPAGECYRSLCGTHAATEVDDDASGTHGGLTSDEARRLLAQLGPNALSRTPGRVVANPVRGRARADGAAPDRLRHRLRRLRRGLPRRSSSVPRSCCAVDQLLPGGEDRACAPGPEGPRHPASVGEARRQGHGFRLRSSFPVTCCSSSRGTGSEPMRW